jgi:hypothetical protein
MTFDRGANLLDPFQYLQTGAGAGPTTPDSAAAQAWAAYYAAQQQQQQQQQQPAAQSTGYPQYSD